MANGSNGNFNSAFVKWAASIFTAGGILWGGLAFIASADEQVLKDSKEYTNEQIVALADRLDERSEFTAAERKELKEQISILIEGNKENSIALAKILGHLEAQDDK